MALKIRTWGKKGISEICAVLQLGTGAWIVKPFDAVLQNESFMILYAGLGSSPRLEIPEGRANHSETTAHNLSPFLQTAPLGSEGMREAGLTHI